MEIDGYGTPRAKPSRKFGRLNFFQLLNSSRAMRSNPDPAGKRSHNQKRFGSPRHRVGQRGIRRFEGQILLAREEPHVRAALLRDVIAERTAQHRIGCLQRIKDGALRNGTLDIELYLAADLRQGPQMSREQDTDHGSVWTSTERTAGRSRTMGSQLSPASADTYTCPPVVPK